MVLNDKRVQWYPRQQVDDQDMIQEREYTLGSVSKFIDRTIGNGIISGLKVEDNSTIMSQATQNQTYDTFLDTVGNQIIQVFKATADNIQQIILYMRQVGVAGSVIFYIYELEDGTNVDSDLKSVPLGNIIISAATITGAFGENTIDFSTESNVSSPGSLTVDNFYALAIERNNSTGSVDVSYADNNPYANGHVLEFVDSTSIYTKRANYDLYMKVYGDAIKVTAGTAYKEGNPIEVATDQENISLIETTGTTNYIVIKYLAVDTDLETHPRNGLPVYSRTQDSFQIGIRTSIGSIASDEELLGTVVNNGSYPLSPIDERVFIPRNNTLWTEYLDKVYDITIETQNEFEWYFGDGTESAASGFTSGGWAYTQAASQVTVTTPKNTRILLKGNPSDGVTTHYKYDATNFDFTALTLKTRIVLSESGTIHGEGDDQTIVILNDDFTKFVTTYKSQATVSGVSLKDFTVNDSSNFKVGEVLHHDNDNNMYVVDSIPDATSVLVDKNITGAGSGTISSCSQHIDVSGFTIDGRSNVNSMGGSRADSEDGSVFQINYSANSKFLAKIINAQLVSASGTATGGVFNGNSATYQNEIGNIWLSGIFSTGSFARGGAIAQCPYSKIHNIHNTFASGGSNSNFGGAVFNCPYSTIEQIYGCYTEGTSTTGNFGGAVSFCYYSVIHDLYDCYCTTELVLGNTTPIGGGGVYDTDYSTIYNIYRNYIESYDGNGLGGAIFSCQHCDVYNIQDCTVTSGGAASGIPKGGACYAVDYSTIRLIQGCSCTGTEYGSTGGACDSCDQSTIDQIYNCSANTFTGIAPKGGGCYECDSSHISNVFNCNSSSIGSNNGEGGGAADCDSCNFCGVWDNNNSDVASNTLDNCQNSAWTLVINGTPWQSTGTADF